MRIKRLMRCLPFPLRFWVWRLTGALTPGRCVRCGGLANIPGLATSYLMQPYSPTVGPICYFCMNPGEQPAWWMKPHWRI